MRIYAAVLTTLLITAAMPVAALADYTYTFLVPATLSNLPSGTGVQIECSVYNGKGGSGAQLATGTSNTVPSTNGAYTGTFTVKVNSATAPASYGCWLLVWSGNSAINIVGGNPSNPVSGWTGTMLTTGNIGG